VIGLEEACIYCKHLEIIFDPGVRTSSSFRFGNGIQDYLETMTIILPCSAPLRITVNIIGIEHSILARSGCHASERDRRLSLERRDKFPPNRRKSGYHERWSHRYAILISVVVHKTATCSFTSTLSLSFCLKLYAVLRRASIKDFDTGTLDLLQ
jgi:hypothetical protein